MLLGKRILQRCFLGKVVVSSKAAARTFVFFSAGFLSYDSISKKTRVISIPSMEETMLLISYIYVKTNFTHLFFYYKL